jgi:tetratricopeptide (TPR) repeat protein
VQWNDYEVNNARYWVIHGVYDFLCRQKRYDEAVALFKATRAAARHNPHVLHYLYAGCRVNRLGEIDADIVEDVRNAYEWLKTTPKDDSRKYTQTAFWSRELLIQWRWDRPDIAIRAGIMDFENDPFAWEVLLMIKDPWAVFNPLLHALLFPDMVLMMKEPQSRFMSIGDVPRSDEWKKQKKSANEKALQKLKDFTLQGKVDHEQLVVIGRLLRESEEYEASNWFLLEQIKVNPNNRGGYYTRDKVYRALADNYRALGDWKNSEKYIETAAKFGWHFIRELQATADLAEKSGAAEDAKRIRMRIANLGMLP